MGIAPHPARNYGGLQVLFHRDPGEHVVGVHELMHDNLAAFVVFAAEFVLCRVCVDPAFGTRSLAIAGEECGNGLDLVAVEPGREIEDEVNVGGKDPEELGVYVGLGVPGLGLSGRPGWSERRSRQRLILRTRCAPS